MRRDVVVTDAVFGGASPLMEQTRARAACNCSPCSTRRLPDGNRVQWRNRRWASHHARSRGSDFSASILAAALDASELWIWTDVDGIMTADPRLVTERGSRQVTYAEAAELAYNGAKVLHPRTLAPLVGTQDSGLEQEQLRAQKPGTKIVPCSRAERRSRGDVDDQRGADIDGTRQRATERARSDGPRARRARPREVEVLTLTSSSYRQSFCFLIRQDELERALEALEEDLALELAHGYLSRSSGSRMSGCWPLWARECAERPAWPVAFSPPFRARHQHYRHRAGLQRVDHRRRGSPRRAGESRPGRSRRVCGLGASAARA